MKKLPFLLIACMLVCAACGCAKKVNPTPEEPEVPVFKLDSYNGHFVQALSDAYDTFEAEGALPGSVNVEGLTYVRGKYIMAACILLEKIIADPDHWQDTEIELTDAAAGSEYRYNTFDPDVIDLAHVRYMAERVLTWTQSHAGSMPNYVTFPSGDPSYFVKNEGKWPESVSSWPASYLDAVRNCPKDDALVKSTLDAALKGLASDASPRQKAEAIFKYARDEWEWENYSNTKKGAIGTINAKTGNCCDLTHATLAMCRAAGIPARYLHGQCFFSSGVIGHVIPEIYVDGKWWICDPSNNSATFGTPTWNGMETFNGRYNELEF